MQWYNGSIAEAVNLCKQRNTIFVVFVEGENDLSVEMSQTIEETGVVKRLSDTSKFLAIKLQSGSSNYTHFAQIYQFVPVPSLFFIGRNGTPLEVVCAGVEPSNLATRIDRILEEHVKEEGVQPSTSPQNLRTRTADMLQAEAAAMRREEARAHPATKTNESPQSSNDQKPAGSQSGLVLETQEVVMRTEAPITYKPVDKKDDKKEPETSQEPAAKVQKTEHHETKSGKEYDVVCRGDVCVRIPKVKPDDPGPSQRSSEVEQEVLVQPEPAETAAELEQKVEKAKEIIEARRREKIEKEKEAERLKEIERRNAGQGVAELKRWQADQELKQIQEERKRERMENNLARQRILDQIAQDRAERRARDAPAPGPAPATPAQPAQAPPLPSGDTSNRARIQFKLPDGTSHTAHFEADNTLETVHEYISTNLQMSRSSFSLWTAFPRRELTAPEETLRQLQLTPSAALLVMTRRATSSVAQPSRVDNIIAFLSHMFAAYILEPSNQLYQWVYARLFAPPAAPRRASPPRDSPPPPPPGLRRRGNIHRLPGERGADDDNNTWNGNSTQQM